MDVLIKFSKDGGFKDICDVRNYFTCTVPRENDFFCHLGRKLAEDVTKMYFTFESTLIAKATYVDFKFDKQNRNFPNAYKIKDIIVFAESIPIKNDLFKGQIISYVRNDEQLNAIAKINKKFLG